MALLLAFFDLAKGLAWPAAIFGLFVMFRVQIRELLPRVRKAGPSGVELEGPQAAEAEQKKVAAASRDAAGESKLQDFPGLRRTPAMADLERRLLADLAVQTGSLSDADRVNFLVWHLAASRMAAEFERIYRVIFGSQIAGLRALNERQRVTIEDARQYFEPIAAAHPDIYKEDGFERWLGFLLNTGLVARTGNTLEITPLGRDFLLFITARGYVENKGY